MVVVVITVELMEKTAMLARGCIHNHLINTSVSPLLQSSGQYETARRTKDIFLGLTERSPGNFVCSQATAGDRLGTKVI